MSIDSSSHSLKLAPSWPIILSGAGLGVVLAWGVLSGDAQGRVNLFYLLFVYLLIPILSLIVASISLVHGKGLNLARVISWLPIWSKQANLFRRKLNQLGVEKFWLYFQSNLASLAYAVSSVVILFLLLLASDVSFVWRSTILTADDVLPFLQFISLPWSFWEQAQPNMSLVELTQDSRLQTQEFNSALGSWWRFVLAVQIFYGLILRSALLLLTSIWFKWKVASDVEFQLSKKLKVNQRRVDSEDQIADVVHQLSSSRIMVTNWGGINLSMIEPFKELVIREDNLMNAGPLANESEQRVAERWQGPQLVLVKSWEPPLAELLDYLQNSQGYVFPIDWNQDGPQKIRPSHLREWQRFVGQLAQWEVFVPMSLTPPQEKL